MGQIGFSDLNINNALRMLDELPKKLNERALGNAAAAALRPARNEASSSVRSIAKGSNEGYSKARFVARSIKVRKSRSGYPPGAFIRVSGPDIPVYDRKWNVAGYAKLLAYGSYKSGKRSWRKNGKNTGKVRGIGNFVLDAVDRNYPFMSKHFETRALIEMEKAKKQVGF